MKAIPSIHTPIQESNGSVAWVWYLFFQWLAENAGKIDLSDYFTKEETEALLELKANTADLATVAFTGDYEDLSNKPDVPIAQVQSDWTQTDTSAVDYIKNKPVLATVATSGDYDDLVNKPTIPAPQIQSDWTQANATAVDFIKNKPTLATVATSGDYDDLINKPTIPAAQVNSDWNANSGVAEILNKPTLGTMAAESASDYTPTVNLAAVALSGAYSDLSGAPNLATVATTGDYDDLINKPTIPTVNDATLTIQKNGTNVATFTANASSNVTANISVPTATNELTNNSGFITSSDIPVTDVTVGGTSVVSSGVAAIPAIPTVNNPTITITQGGVTKGSFTLNQASGDTIALDAGGSGSVDIDNTTITTNADDEIQAVATINANSATGATNPVYDWVGTLSEYETQNVATNHPDWVCYITDDIGGPATIIAELAEGLNDKADLSVVNNKVDKGHQVIAYQEPTSSNSYTWYRKYADGWVEQGGYGTVSNGGTNINLPIAMADTGYYVNIATVNGDTGRSRSETYAIRYTTYFVGYKYDASFVVWEVKGKAA